MNLIFLLVLIGISANLDNLGVGIAYGVRRINIPPLSNLIIAVIAFFIGCLSVWAGAFIGRFLSDTAANIIGAILIIGVGIWVIFSQEKKPGVKEIVRNNNSPSLLAVLQEPELADLDQSSTISWNETGILGVALSINVLTNGLTAGLWKLGVLPSSLSMALFSYLTIWLGTWLGSRYGARWLGEKASVAAGILLILIGLHQLI